MHYQQDTVSTVGGLKECTIVKGEGFLQIKKRSLMFFPLSRAQLLAARRMVRPPTPFQRLTRTLRFSHTLCCYVVRVM